MNITLTDDKGFPHTARISTGYKADLIKAKARLYYLLTQFPEGELADDSPELDMLYALSRDQDMQEVLNKK